jgi:hypothetical protein
MRECPDERTLERLFVGERLAAQERHVTGCPQCALRMRRIEQDLTRIREALFQDPPQELLRPAARRLPVRPVFGALVLAAAAACLAVVFWTQPASRETNENRSELPGFVHTASQALFPGVDDDSGGISNPHATQLAALGVALSGGRPCTVEDQSDTDSCDVQDVAEGW